MIDITLRPGVRWIRRVVGLASLVVVLTMLVTSPAEAQETSAYEVGDDVVDATLGVAVEVDLTVNDRFDPDDFLFLHEFNTPLPPGFVFDSGILSGIPTQVGTFSFNYIVGSNVRREFDFGQVAVTVREPAGFATVIGQVIGPSGPLADTQVDLFRATPEGTRGEFLGSTTSDTSSQYRLSVRPDCYILTFTSPIPNVFVFTETGTRYVNRAVCVDKAGTVTRVPVVELASKRRGELIGEVVYSPDTPAPKVQVDLFSVGRGTYLRSVWTDVDGRFLFRSLPRCYVLTYIAPDGYRFATGKYLNRDVCIPSDLEPLRAVLIADDAK